MVLIFMFIYFDWRDTEQLESGFDVIFSIGIFDPLFCISLSDCKKEHLYFQMITLKEESKLGLFCILVRTVT